MNISRRNQGFTLIELLIVIIIIGILAAIAIPMFISQRDRAKDAAVKEGVHMIQLGLASYAVDRLDIYPAALADDSALVDADGTPYVDNWPVNPWTQDPMVEDGSRGNYSYTPLLGRTTFTLAGHLAADDFVVP